MLLFSTIIDINNSMTKDAFIKLVIDWNQGSPHESNIIPGIKWTGEKNIRYGSENLWLDIEEYRNENIIAVRFEKKEEDGAVWDTDYVMNFNMMKMSIRLDRSYTADALEADFRFSTPHFIALLIERGYIKDDYLLPVGTTEIVINNENIDILLDVINNKSHYKLPIVYVSKTYYDENPVNTIDLSKKLRGVAHVLVEEGNWLDQTIRDQCDCQNEYHGAIGVYYPSRVMRHKKFFYRNLNGYDDNLLKRVVSAVIQYSNSQMVETLFTWQGVNNALLLDRLTSQRKERMAAEEARQEAEAKAAKLIDSLDEEENRIRRQALDDARLETDKILESFDEDMKKLQNQVEVLTRINEALQFENPGLKMKIDSRESIPVLYMGDECEFYTGEIKDLLLITLSDALKGMEPKTRKADVVNDIIDNNGYQKISEFRTEEIKRILNNYDGMTPKIKQSLKELGFEVSEEGKHYKITYYGDGRYQTTVSKTPGDNRTGKNSAQTMMNMAF